MKELIKKFSGFYYSLSIRKKISILFILAFSIVLAILAILTYKVSSNILINKAVDNTVQNINLVLKQFDIIFDNAENYSKIAITDKNVQDILDNVSPEDPLVLYNNEKIIQNILGNIIYPKTFIDSVMIYDTYGNIYDSGGIMIDSEISNTVPEFSQYDKSLLWIDTQRSNYQRDLMNFDIVTLFRKVQSAQTGRFIGAVETCITERYISSLYSNIKLGETGEIFVVNLDGQIVSHTDKELVYKNIRNEPYFDWIEKGEGGKIFLINNIKYLVVCRHYPRLNWIITGLVPLAEVTKDNRDLTGYILLIGITCVILAVFLSIMIAASITNPLIKLKKAMKYIGDGDFETRVHTNSKDEVGVLAMEFNKMAKRTSELMSNIFNEQKKKREYELALLQSQINPHFLYNTLESICGLAELNRNDEIINTVSKLAAFYRGVLSKGSNVIPVREEINITRNYLEIIKVRYGQSFDYSFELDEEVYRFNTVKLVLQPLVENSISHGLRNKKGKGLIVIKGFVDSDKVNLHVIDNGIGMKPEDIEFIFKPQGIDYKTKSFGIKSTDERIKLYFGLDYGLEVDSTYGVGTTVKVSLPAREIGG